MHTHARASAQSIPRNTGTRSCTRLTWLPSPSPGLRDENEGLLRQLQEALREGAGASSSDADAAVQALRQELAAKAEVWAAHLRLGGRWGEEAPAMGFPWAPTRVSYPCAVFAAQSPSTSFFQAFAALEERMRMWKEKVKEVAARDQAGQGTEGETIPTQSHRHTGIHGNTPRRGVGHT